MSTIQHSKAPVLRRTDLSTTTLDRPNRKEIAQTAFSLKHKELLAEHGTDGWVVFQGPEHLRKGNQETFPTRADALRFVKDLGIPISADDRHIQDEGTIVVQLEMLDPFEVARMSPLA